MKFGTRPWSLLKWCALAALGVGASLFPACSKDDKATGGAGGDGGTSGIPLNCGDGVPDPDEECDDGDNGDDADGCRFDCRYTCHVNNDCTNHLTCDGEELC